MSTRDSQLSVFFRWAAFFALQGTESAGTARRAAFLTIHREIERGIPGSRRRRTTLARRAARRGGTSRIAARYWVPGDDEGIVVSSRFARPPCVLFLPHFRPTCDELIALEDETRYVDLPSVT